MPSRRDQIKMSETEQQAFIAEQKSLQVATINRDGTPHLSTLWFDIVDGELVFETFTKSQKIKNLERDPRITCLLEDGLVYEELRGIQINGTAELHSDPETVHRYARGVLVRNNPEIPQQMVDAAAESMSAKRTVVVVKSLHVATWDHTKLGGAPPYTPK
ncbi:MAG: pyridoxamine 5'-phosphate oxidase family protein [Acidimicrobiales bacterium]|nr:pyridoxamine 5'-phosphate oxidase family protein [Acidimicrobiales bacterium]MDG1845845.1 pyridoxamine 5'-phosphate oxidase family protein [Acidimicrobiales bacterium]